MRRGRAAATKIQTLWRAKDAKAKFIKVLELHNAAMFIQCLARMRAGKKVAEAKRASRDIDKWSKMILIQKRVRMCLARWKVEEMLEMEAGAWVIQRGVRAWIARERLKNLRFLRDRHVRKIVLVQR